MNPQNLVEKARSFSSKHLSNKPRLAGDTVRDHAQRVFDILVSNSINDDLTLAAAILHPITDFEDYNEDNIKSEFGHEMVEVLRNYSRLKKSKIDKETPRSYNEAYFMQAYLKLSGDMRTLVIRLADRLDNLSDSFALSKEKRTTAAQKVIYLYALVAKAIGLNKMYRKMEDDAFKILNPGQYHRIENVLNKKILLAEEVLKDAEKFLNQVLDEKGLEAEISKRFKHKYGVFKKLKKGQKLENIYDLIAMRMVVDSIENCYVVETILRDLWDEYPQERDDYIAKPRPSGYQSLHGVFKLAKGVDVEVQIRTKEMHEFNEYGPASHLLYKIGDKGNTSPAHKKFLEYTQGDKFWFKDLNLQSQEGATIDSKLDSPFAKYVYAFTPKGDIIELNNGSTILDFAYAVHSSLGDRCLGAFVNKQYVGLDHIVQDGDFIEIKTLKKDNVNSDWLKIVKTTKAKSHIRKALRKGK